MVPFRSQFDSGCPTLDEDHFGGVNKKAAMDAAFQNALRIACRTVESWPRWKQTSLIATMQSKNPKERKPVMSHTSGPWKLWDGHGAIRNNPIIVDSIPNHEGKFVGNCICYVATTNPDCQANADLIAAAPDMLEALRNIVKHQDSIGGELAKMPGTRRIAAEAIKKATGEQV